MKSKLRSKGEIFRPVTKVLKEKNGLPTKIEINGQEYALLHPTFINGNRSKVN
ncbi:MAG: hypothetical protein R3250_07015 [Melioribacteraceae bacterium]|nr:hypothetical protein [Melioribacteraceae bacterium]